MSVEKKKNPSKRSEPTPDSAAKRFVFRDREWPTFELKREFFALRNRKDELLYEKKKSRLSDEKWRELNLVLDGLEHIGPELERRERNKAKRSAKKKLTEGKNTGNGKKNSLRRNGQRDFLGSNPKTDEFSSSYAGELIDVMFPEGGKKTFLDEKTLGMVAELTKIKSAIHNSQERIRKSKKPRAALKDDFDLLSAQQKKRKEIVSRLQQAYNELEVKLSEADESSVGTDRKAVRERLMLSNAAEELRSIIGGINRVVTADEKSIAKIRNDQSEGDAGEPDVIERSDGALQLMTERQINEELKRLGWIIAESQGPIEEFETEIQELKTKLAQDKEKFGDLMGKKDSDPYVEIFRGSIAEAEANLLRKMADLEFRRHPDLIGDRIRSLERERGRRFPRSAEKNDNARRADLPAPEDAVVRLKRRAEKLRSELGLHKVYLEELGHERVAEVGRFKESLSKWSEQWKKIEDIKRVLTGVKSTDAISARLEEEKPATTDSLKRIDATIREITKKMQHAEEELSALLEEIGLLEAIPDAGQANPVLDEEGIMSNDFVVHPEPVILKMAVSVEEEPLIIPDNRVIQSKPGREVNEGVPTGPKAFTEVTLSDTVRERFDSFGISSTELASVDGFAELITEGQQLFVAEMLRQTAARKIEDRARDAVVKKSGLLKSYHLAASRKDAAGQVLHGGMETYGEDLRQLVEWMKVSGLDVEEKDGKFDIRFFSIPKGSENESLLVSERASFNEVANRFATIPHEWSLPGASKDEQKRYKETKTAYDEAYGRLDGIVNRDRGLDDPTAYATLREENVALRIADNRVRLIQHLMAHPEVGKQLEKFEQQNAFLAGMKSVVAERGAYAVFGAAGRFLLGATPLGLLAAPAVASISGAITARIRSGESLREQDRQARRGKDSARVLSNTSRAFVLATGDSKRKGLAERLDLIVSKTLDLSDGDAGAREKAVEALQARIAYTWKKIDSGLVNFGTEGAIGNQVRLEEALSNAEMTLSLFSGGATSEQRRERLLSGQDGLQERMNRVLDFNERKVALERNRFKNTETVKGAVISGTISLLGAGFIHKAMEWFHEVADSVEMPVNGSVNASGVLEHRDAVLEATRMKPGFTSGRGVVPEASTGKALTEVGTPSAVPTANDATSVLSAPKGVVAEMAKQVVVEKASKAAEIAGRTYSETAKSGDSVTTLARRALAEYVRENNLSGLTPEQKVFIEDYLQKKVARGGTLRVGEKIEFTKDFLNEALGRAKVLDTDQLQNLHRYVEQVGEFRTGSPSAQVIPMESGGDVLSAGNASEIPSSEPGLSDRVPKVSSVPAMAEDAAALTKGGPPAATAEGATETGNQVGALRNTVESNAARDFLADPNHVEPFRKAAAGTVRELFSTSAGEVNEKLFLKAGKMTSKVVFRDCLLAVADPEKMAFIDGFDVKGVRRLGKFLIAARRAGIHPEIGIGKTETFRVYIERVSVRLAERNMDPSELIASVSDRDLDGFAGSALEVWRNQGT